MDFHVRCWVLIAFCAALVIGCSGGGGPQTAPVSGTVTYDGQPVAGVKVVFIPKEGGSRNASGVTDAQGRFQLTMFEENDGAVPGEYSVSISEATGADLGDISAEDPSAAYGDAMEAAATGEMGADASEEEAKIPAKYGDPAKSGLDRTVEPGKNHFEFNLE